MHYDVVGSPLKTKVRVKKGRAAKPDELVTVEHYRRVKRLSVMGTVPDEFEVNDDLILAPEDATHGDIVCYEVGFDHLGRSAHMKRRHQLRVTLNSRIKRDRVKWLLRKRQIRENAFLRILTSYKHSVVYSYAHIHMDRRAFPLASWQGGKIYCPEAAERLVNVPRNDWSTPGDIQASLGVAKYALDWAFQAQIQGNDLAIEHSPSKSFRGSRVKHGWNAVYLRRPTGQVLGPIGEYKVYKRHRYLTAKELTALRKKRGPIYRFCRNAVEAEVARWLFAHPYPHRDDEKYRVLRNRLEAEERWLNDHIEFHRCEHVSTQLHEKSPSRSDRVRETCRLQVNSKLGYANGLVSLDAARHEDAKLEQSGWVLRLYSPLVMSSDRELSTLVTMHQLVAPEGQETTPSSGKLLTVSAGLWGPRTPKTDHSPLPADIRIMPKTWQKPHKEIEMSLGPEVDPLADTWPSLENRIGTRVPLLADLQISHPHPFSLARAVGELKDTRETLSPAFDFLSWALKYRDKSVSDFGPIRISERWYLPYEKYASNNRPLPPKEWSRKLDKLTHARLSTLPIKAVAGAYLWWKFGVEPVINDVNLLMMDVRYALNSSRTGLISMFSKAGAALHPATLRSSVATGSAHELLERKIESFIVPMEVDTTEVTIHAPVFPSPVSLMSSEGVHPQLVDGMVNLGDAVLGDAVRVNGKAQSVVELPARIPDFASYFRHLERRSSLPSPGIAEIQYFEHILGHLDTSYFMRIASLRSRCMRGSKVFARFDAETINRELHTTEIGELVAQLGPHQRAWELTPLSFVVDWFFTTHELAAVLDAVSNKNVHSIPDDGQGIWLAHKLAKLYACQTAREASMSVSIGRPRDIRVLVEGTKYNWDWTYKQIFDREWAGFNGALAENVGADWKHLEMPSGLHSDGIMGEFAPFLEASFTLSHFQYDEVPWNWDGQVSVFRRGKTVSQWSDMLPQLKLKLGEGKMVSLLAILFGVV